MSALSLLIGASCAPAAAEPAPASAASASPSTASPASRAAAPEKRDAKKSESECAGRCDAHVHWMRGLAYAEEATCTGPAVVRGYARTRENLINECACPTLSSLSLEGAWYALCDPNAAAGVTCDMRCGGWRKFASTVLSERCAADDKSDKADYARLRERLVADCRCPDMLRGSAEDERRASCASPAKP